MPQSTANKALLEALKITGHHPPAGTTVNVEIPCAEEWISQDGLVYHNIAKIWYVEFGAMDGSKQLYYLSHYPCYDAIKNYNERMTGEYWANVGQILDRSNYPIIFDPF